MNPNEDTPKSFDIKRVPGEPSPTSRPLIVGHRPHIPDPMVHREAPATPPAPQPDLVSMPPPTAQPTMPVTDLSAQMPIQPAPPPPTPAVAPQPAVNQPPAEPAPPAHLPEEFKVHLPAGKAGRGVHKKAAWLILVIIVAAAVAAGSYLLIHRIQQ